MARESINQALPTPLYYQIYIQLREKILNGTYSQGSLLHSENEIEDLFGVSRITAKRALDELASEGLVARQRGRGTTVIYSAPKSQSNSDMDGLIENLVSIAQETEVTLLDFEYTDAPVDAVAALALNPEDKVQHAVRVRHKDQVPFSYVVTYVPERIGRSYSKEDLASYPILALIERSGVIISRARQTITATLADSATAPALNIQVGAPLLKIVRTVYDDQDRPVEYITVYYRPEVYTLNQTLSRVGLDSAKIWTTSD